MPIATRYAMLVNRPAAMNPKYSSSMLCMGLTERKKEDVGNGK